jgi:DNA polymerase-1
MAEYSQDESMLEDFKSGVDIHTRTTERLIPLAPRFYNQHKAFDAKRKASKAVNFGIIYLTSAFGLADRLGISKDLAGEIIRAWFKMYPGVKRWIERIKKEAIRKGQVKSLIGRIRRVPGASVKDSVGWEKIRQAVNSPIQGLASDLNVMAMVEINDKLKKGGFKSGVIGNVHDASMIDTHPCEKEAVYDIVWESYLDPGLKRRFGIDLSVPLEVDVKQNESWSKG